MYHADCDNHRSLHTDKKEGKNEMDIDSHRYFDDARILYSASDSADACSRFDRDVSGKHAQPRPRSTASTWVR
jgi:hypothetical protein